MKPYKIPVSWEVYGYVYVEAESLQEAILLADGDDVTLPVGEYIEGSFQIDYEALEEE